MFEKFGWNANNMFFLTRDHPIEITEEDKLFYYGNQCWIQNDPLEGIDQFGRNSIDKTFIAICLLLHVFVTGTRSVTFHSLATRKEGDKYLVRVQYDDEDLEMEVKEMFHYFIKKLERRNDGQR